MPLLTTNPFDLFHKPRTPKLLLTFYSIPLNLLIIFFHLASEALNICLIVVIKYPSSIKPYLKEVGETCAGEPAVLDWMGKN